jgi:hypothetical protein
MKTKCKCGYQFNDPQIIHQSTYSKWGWFLLTILGLSAKPKQIKFICSECKEIVLVSSEPDILKKFIGR